MFHVSLMQSTDTIIFDRPAALYLWTVMSTVSEDLRWDRVVVAGLIEQANTLLGGAASDPSLSLRRTHEGLDGLAADLKSRLDQIDMLWSDVDRINELTEEIADWTTSDSAARLDFLVRNRRERISAFMGGDEQATLMIVELIDGGLDLPNAIGITEQRLFNARVLEVREAHGGSVTEAQEYVRHLDYQLAVLGAHGFVGEEAAAGVALAMNLNVDVVDLIEVGSGHDVTLVDAAAWLASSRAIGVSVAELLALQGFRENLNELDNSTGGKRDDKVGLADLRYVVGHPWKFAPPTVIAAQAMLDNPGLWNRLDTASRNDDLFVGKVFGSRKPGDGVVSLKDLENFMVKSQIHTVLKDYRNQIDVAADSSGQADGFYSRADFERFIEDNPHLPDEVLIAADAALQAGWFHRNWFERYRDDLALGAAVLAGGAVIVLSGGAATPLVLAAGAAAGAAAAGGTALVVNLTGDANDAFDGVWPNVRNGAVVGLTVVGLPAAIKSVGATTGAARVEAVAGAATDVAVLAACGALDIVVPEEAETEVQVVSEMAVSAATMWSTGSGTIRSDPKPGSFGSLAGGVSAAAETVGCEVPDEDEAELPEWTNTARDWSLETRSFFELLRSGIDTDPAVDKSVD